MLLDGNGSLAKKADGAERFVERDRSVPKKSVEALREINVHGVYYVQLQNRGSNARAGRRDTISSTGMPIRIGHRSSRVLQRGPSR
eukprot:IDg11423t1